MGLVYLKSFVWQKKGKELEEMLEVSCFVQHFIFEGVTDCERLYGVGVYCSSISKMKNSCTLMGIDYRF